MYEELFQTAEDILEGISDVLGVTQVQTATVADGIALNTLPWLAGMARC